jgi:hypothetical protein
MFENSFRKFLSAVLSFLLVTGSSESLFGYQAPANAPANADPSAPAPMGPADLQALVAPIALYPDALVAQILGAGNLSRPGCRG